MVWSQMLIANHFRTRKEKLILEFQRRIGLFEATIYLESKHLNDPDSQVLTSNSHVEIFGDFSPMQPWQVSFPCTFDK